MIISRLYGPPKGAILSSNTLLQSTISALETLRIGNAPGLSINSTTVRHATHKSQGVANGTKQGAGRRLGAKKSGGQYVIPGNIIFRQRGTHWFPGDNCDMGRDHTIFATQPGYVKYYKDPYRHPKRQYIGVVFERNQTLPQPPNAARRRRLGMLALQRQDVALEGVEVVGQDGEGMANTEVRTEVGGNIAGGEAAVAIESTENLRSVGRTTRATPKPSRHVNTVDAKGKPLLVLRPGYQYREANWQIGRAAERAGVKVETFKPGNRFLAWRKATARKEKNAEKRRMRGGKKKK